MKVYLVDSDEMSEAPEWAAELVTLLIQTEDHDSELVRLIHELVLQAGIALEQATSDNTSVEAEEPVGPTDENDMAHREDPDYRIEQAYAHHLDPPKSASSTNGTSRKRKTSATVLALRERGFDAADVRRWARANGINVPARGSLPRGVVDDFLVEAV